MRRRQLKKHSVYLGDKLPPHAKNRIVVGGENFNWTCKDKPSPSVRRNITVVVVRSGGDRLEHRGGGGRHKTSALIYAQTVASDEKVANVLNTDSKNTFRSSTVQE
ncbi:hypothetical protein L2E82_09891 [Cichorium intybus]|uniref:Uncharacterized protein n=1 Tax=Cichorium intybus TaxID=13427 RepID=A0ACB9G9Y9_CICIN|nr:hypothetical protein L2E82_09891 [Cichorium intybus]